MAKLSHQEWISMFEESLEPSAAARRSAARSSSCFADHLTTDRGRSRAATPRAAEGSAFSTARSQAARYYGREATARIPQPVHETKAAESQPELQVVTRRRPRRGVVASVIALAAILLVIGVVTPVLISAAVTGMESEIGRLERQEQDLQARSSSLAAQVSTLSAPDRVVEQAMELGLGPAVSVRYLEVPGGTTTAGDHVVEVAQSAGAPVAEGGITVDGP